ncbi:MAG: pyruvate:ferredoxin (flavodoxin) oxidoreductase, partial [Bacteroidetes bacterium]|nr:pyruvate:ferredoxin (flavodoxin) oxidoreductase [Bacteroidota bacterium]
HLNENGEKTGVLKLRLFRPFDVQRFVDALPASVRKIAVLDRTKEPGSIGEPLYQDVVTAVQESMFTGMRNWPGTPVIVGGRYGLSSKEFTPAMVKSVFDNLSKERPKNHFTVGINDDLTNTSLVYDENFDIEKDTTFRALFYGLGSDGTVGANKNTIKIIGEHTDNYAQGYFVYDSKKSGAMTVSHLRFGPDKILSPFLINKANFVACHQPIFLEQNNMVDDLLPGGVFLVNAPFKKEEIWDKFPRSVQKQIIEKNIKIFFIDAQEVAKNSGMGRRINTVMQTCFFAISGVLPKEDAIVAIKASIKKTYAKKGDRIVNMNLLAVDNTLEHLHEIEVPASVDSAFELSDSINGDAPEFVKEVLGTIIAGKGDDLPVSAFPVDGTFPTGTTQYEKRNIALQIPVWDESICIQCNKCVAVCPHATIRAKVFDPTHLEDAPETFKATNVRDKNWKADGLKYSLQVAAEDCTGCSVCVEVCPVKNKSNVSLKAINMEPQLPLRDQERENWDFFTKLPEMERSGLKLTTLRHQQLQLPLFEFSGACSGCGETPYIKMMTQLFGDRALIANATGCSSIYGGNLPTTPYTTNNEGRGPAWSNSLFEDNAEFGLGYRLSIDENNRIAKGLVRQLTDVIGQDLANDILTADQSDEPGIFEQRKRIAHLKAILDKVEDNLEAKRLLTIAEYLVKKSVWIVGGDGWAYDIGYGGLDHVIASGKNVNILVMDTEVYSNTGGQTSKATPLSAVAKFSAGGKATVKKDLGLMAMSYGNVYVAVVAMGARDEQTLKAFIEAEKFDGPSIIIAYSHCIAHGIDMEAPLKNQKAAVDSGQWVLYRYNPTLLDKGKNPFVLDSKPKKVTVAEYMNMENRFRILKKSKPEVANEFFKQAQIAANDRFKYLQYLASRPVDELVK